MPKRRHDVQAPIDPSPTPEPPLKRQSRWSGVPWQPGEIPAGSFMPISRPHDEGETIYGHPRMGVEKPKKRGRRRAL